jgi:hypothetical protein
MASEMSRSGDEITYSPLAHLPRSMSRQRSLQNGKSGSFARTAFLQMGQRSLMARLRAMTLQDFRDQIVIVSFGDLATIELAGLRLQIIGSVVHQNFAVDFGGVHGGAAFEQKIAFLG